ncbi:lipoyl domain-containing protein [Pseudonocardia spinosispora]|uniref:lipoyl domain-containing protein n=1 Tax=Pseudonocardia spinosispora TaxID=103441 RepID=UPI000421E888|nr:lipoyl domain-containing protein [Pseudonocardia spinosispora]
MTEVTIPKLGLTMDTGVLTSWLVSDGALVGADQPIAELATDKTETEIVAPAAGVLRIVAEPSDDELPVGTVIAHLDPPVDQP